jgi:type I restriction enzyme M protein
MILRGDGKSGIRNHDVFTADDFPVKKCNVALMNPPFPHKKTDIPPQKFIDRALEALETRGRLAVILPTSYVVKKSHGSWREELLSKHTLLAVCELPDEVFQPYASTTTTVVLLENNVPHNEDVATVFCRIHYDGLTLKKGVRVPRSDKRNEIADAVNSILNKREVPGFSGVAHIKGDMEWAPGAYIPSSLPSDEVLKEELDDLIRRYVSFYTRYAPQISTQRKLIERKELIQKDYRKMISKLRIKNANELPSEPGTIGHYFNIFYGQKELHSRDGIPPGDSLIISPTEDYNGTYGWLKFDELLQPPFVTVAQTGSIGEAFVQSEACGVNDDCLVILPRGSRELSLASYFICAAIIRIENWRFSYGRKLTPSRINEFKISISQEMESWVAAKIDNWQKVIDETLAMYD